jgi:hypothetical protein
MSSNIFMVLILTSYIIYYKNPNMLLLLYLLYYGYINIIYNSIFYELLCYKLVNYNCSNLLYLIFKTNIQFILNKNRKLNKCDLYKKILTYSFITSKPQIHIKLYNIFNKYEYIIYVNKAIIKQNYLYLTRVLDLVPVNQIINLLYNNSDKYVLNILYKYLSKEYLILTIFNLNDINKYLTKIYINSLN